MDQIGMKRKKRGEYLGDNPLFSGILIGEKPLRGGNK
jgi:hypothetical protein